MRLKIKLHFFYNRLVQFNRKHLNYLARGLNISNLAKFTKPNILFISSKSNQHLISSSKLTKLSITAGFLLTAFLFNYYDQREQLFSTANCQIAEINLDLCKHFFFVFI